MRVHVAGLSDQSMVAMARVVGLVFPGAELVHQPRGVGNVPPALWAAARRCEITVLDLLGLGLARWTPERQALLQALVTGGQRAVLIAPPGDGGGWLQALQTPAASLRLVLQHPLTAAAMRAALTSLAKPDAPAAAPQLPAQAATPVRKGQGRLGAPLPPAWAGAADTASVVADGQGGTSSPAVATHTLENQPAQPEPQAFVLTAAALAELQAACPELGQRAYLKLVCETAMQDAPQELQIGGNSGVLVHAGQNWAACNVSAALRRRLTQHASMVQIIKAQRLPAEQAVERAARLYGRRKEGRRPLDEFIWALAYSSFDGTPPLATGDLRFQLRTFPNFTHLAATPDVFIQMALVCLSGPQSLRGLMRSFARHDPRQVSLFVLCAVLSGMATLLPVQIQVDEAGATGPVPAAPTANPAAVAALRRSLPGAGFIRSLLSKLF